MFNEILEKLFGKKSDSLFFERFFYELMSGYYKSFGIHDSFSHYRKPKYAIITTDLYFPRIINTTHRLEEALKYCGAANDSLRIIYVGDKDEL